MTDQDTDRDPSRYDAPTPGTERYWEELSDRDEDDVDAPDQDVDQDQDQAGGA